MSEAPHTGILTFLFTDLEDSTDLWERFPEVMPPALSRHDAMLREAVESHRGHLVKTTGDGLHAVFMSASDGVAAALAGQEAIMNAEWPVETGAFKVRMGLHTGESQERDGDYFGAEVNRAARVMGIGHGGQILVTEVTAALIRKTLPLDLSLEDLGEHGLKGLAATEHIFQVRHPKIPSTFPPLRSLDQRLTNLPSQLNTFIGRAKELAETTAILQREDVRLLTLTGPGGTGKTRLSLQVAEKATDEFEHGTFFLPLAPLRDPSLVVSAIAQLWGLRESGGQTLLEKVQAYLLDKQLLLVLDNFEQVLGAGPLVADLLMEAPQLKVLATSREALHVYGEHTFFVPPLELPDPGDLPPLDDLVQYEAVGLFIERAQAARSGFELSQGNAQSIVEICQRLDGLPLAIELAAARVRLLPPETMLERMAHTLPLLTGGARDLPERQQTLHNAISWSYDLLEEEEKILFRRLAVFASATLEAMETVCNTDGALPASLLDVVESLIDQSLLKLEDADGETRFQMLGTIREYARNVLHEEGELENLQEQHLHFFLQLIEHSSKEMYGPRQAIWMTRLKQERNNLREALEWSFGEAEQIPTGTKMVEAHVQFWQLRGEIVEWSVWINLALEKNKHAPSLVRANLLEGKGFLAIHLTNYNQAKTLFDQSRAFFEECEDAEGIGRVMTYQAHVALGQGHLDRAKDYAEKSLEHNQGLGDSSWLTAASLFAVGDAAYMLGEFRKAWKNYEQGLNLSEELGIGFAIARRRVRLGQTALALGDFTLAREHLAEGLAVGWEVSDNWALVMALGGFGCLAKEQSQPEYACRLLGAAQFQLDSFGGHFFPLDQREYDQTLDQVRTMLHPDAFKAIWEEGRAMTMETAMRYALELNDTGAG